MVFFLINSCFSNEADYIKIISIVTKNLDTGYVIKQLENITLLPYFYDIDLIIKNRDTYKRCKYGIGLSYKFLFKWCENYIWTTTTTSVPFIAEKLRPPLIAAKKNHSHKVVFSI